MKIDKFNAHHNMSTKSHGGHKDKDNIEPKDNAFLSGNQSADDTSKRIFDLRKKLVDPQNRVPDGVRTDMSKGTLEKGETTVEIGTFNMEWLGGKPRTDKDYAKLAQVVKDTGAEVLGIQEIGGEAGMQKLMKNLPEYGYIIGTTGVRTDGKKQNVGVIYNKERVNIKPDSIRELTEAQVPDLIGDTHLRAPLIVEMKADNFDFTFVVVHFKARMDDETVKIRNEQTKIVNKWIKDQVATNPDKDIIVVGDCNDFLNSKSLKSLSDGVLHMTTAESAVKGEYSNIPHHSLIDQIGVTTAEGGAVEEYITGSTHVVDTTKYQGYRKWGSDHSPVISSFRSDKDND